MQVLEQYRRNARAVLDSLMRLQLLRTRYELRGNRVTNLVRERDGLAAQYAGCRADINELAARYARLDTRAVRYRKSRNRWVAVSVAIAATAIGIIRVD